MSRRRGPGTEAPRGRSAAPCCSTKQQPTNRKEAVSTQTTTEDDRGFVFRVSLVADFDNAAAALAALSDLEDVVGKNNGDLQLAEVEDLDNPEAEVVANDDNTEGRGTRCQG